MGEEQAAMRNSRALPRPGRQGLDRKPGKIGEGFRVHWSRAGKHEQIREGYRSHEESRVEQGKIAKGYHGRGHKAVRAASQRHDPRTQSRKGERR